MQLQRAQQVQAKERLVVAASRRGLLAGGARLGLPSPERSCGEASD